MTARVVLDGIKARLRAARPGPWLVNDEEQTVRVESAEGGEWGGEIMYDRSAEHPTYWVSEFRPDAVFIAHSPADVAYLLAELRKRDDALARLEGIHVPVAAVMYSGSQQRMVQVCTGCGTDDGNWMRWPCPTMAAVAAATGGGDA